MLINNNQYNSLLVFPIGIPYWHQDPNGKNTQSDTGAPAAVPEKGDEMPIETIRPLKAKLPTLMLPNILIER